MKNIRIFLSENVQVLVVKFSIHLNRRFFVMLLDTECGKDKIIQSTLVISALLISNNRLSRSKNLVPVLTWKSINRQQNIVEKRKSCP